mmetsp:Transcript_3133/g.7550  ORF Transcript_3133/g.7550 Transcript_3133/m.7550 type:complete len:267 (-) Transcript_3133:112-912(-)
MLSVDEFEADASQALAAAAEKKKDKKLKKKGGAEAAAADGVSFAGGQLSCAGKDWAELPRDVAEAYGGETKRLDLCYNELVTLQNVDRFRGLHELVLDNNSLGDDVEFPPLPDLHTLSLNKNRISDTEKFLKQIKAAYPKLRFLSLLGNKACPNELVLKDEQDYQRYRYFVLFHLPGLKFLDSRTVNKDEVTEASRVGEFMKVITVTHDEMYATEGDAAAAPKSQFNPLPQEARDVSTHRGTIGTCKYVYYGRHSEGNRFIRNNDL